ncbi:MAG TPA: DUF6602 domain-containing protein [Actinomycetota bacterium]|nr:DUF6602 domain-containing protein [Actinomycetota bacterium]
MESDSGRSDRDLTLLDAADYFSAEIRARVPRYDDLLRSTCQQLPSLMSLQYGFDGGPQAVGRIVQQAVNDLVDLFVECRQGRGRPALRSTRALIEHAINAREVVSSVESASRYEQHQAMTSHALSRLCRELDALPPTTAAIERDRLEELERTVAAQAEDALARWGSGFRSRWAGDNLRNLAAKHGLSEEYEFYRIASSVIHGTSGGIIGLARQIEGQSVRRTGPALSLCPSALLWGIDAFLQLLATIRTPTTLLATHAIEDELRRLRDLWPEYRQAVLALDEEAWPEAPPARLTLVKRLFAQGGSDWWIHDQVTWRVCRAAPPTLPAQMEASIAKFEDAYRGLCAESTPVEPWILVAIFEVGSVPEGAVWIDAEDIRPPGALEATACPAAQRGLAAGGLRPLTRSCACGADVGRERYRSSGEARVRRARPKSLGGDNSVPGIVPQVVEAMNREVLNELALTKAIAHPGESGRAREQVLTAFLRRLIPDDFAISTGFVIDHSGSISRQVDVVVYRRSYHPVIVIGGVNHFLAESVAAVFEVKASIRDRATLHQALENLESVKRLDRSAGGENYTLPYGNPVDPQEFQFQVFGAVVTEESMTTDSIGETIAGFISDRPRALWPNMYADVHRLTYVYRSETGGIGAVPATADALVAWEGDRTWPPLVELAFETVNLLRVTPVIDFSPVKYFGSGDAGPIVGLDISHLSRP